MPFLICPWLDNKSAAVVLSYDDWSPGHQLAVRDLMANQLPATFFVTLKYTNPEFFPVRGYGSAFELMKEAISHGIEIANHTTEHPFLTELNAEDLQAEINGTKKRLETLLAPYSCETFTYTYGLFNEHVLGVVMEEHIAARTTALPEKGWNYDFADNEEDYFRLATKEIGTETDLAEVRLSLEEGIKSKALLTFMMHSIDGTEEGLGDVWWQPISISKHHELLEMFKQYKKNVWITTIRDAVKYHKQRKNTTINVIREKDQLKISLIHHLDKRYSQPMTMEFKNGSGRVKSIYQAGIVVRFKESEGNVYFNTIPNSGEILIKLNSEIKPC